MRVEGGGRGFGPVVLDNRGSDPQNSVVIVVGSIPMHVERGNSCIGQQQSLMCLNRQKKKNRIGASDAVWRLLCGRLNWLWAEHNRHESQRGLDRTEERPVTIIHSRIGLQDDGCSSTVPPLASTLLSFSRLSRRARLVHSSLLVFREASIVSFRQSTTHRLFSFVGFYSIPSDDVTFRLVRHWLAMGIRYGRRLFFFLLLLLFL